MNRLEKLPTLRVNPVQPITFTFAGKYFRGQSGDTIASALYANGVRIFSRSLKYHRPRGLYSLDGECSNTCVNVDGIPNVCAENTLLKEGMRVSAQNVKGNPETDIRAFMDKLDWAMPAGFYYRSMHKPARIWPIALKQVRKAAGLGIIAPDFQMPGKYDEIYPTADVCIIGGGPAGMTAALTAAQHGLRVILLETRPWLGGFFDYRAAEFGEGIALHQRARELTEKIAQASNIRTFLHTAVVGTYSNNLITAFQKGTEKGSFCRAGEGRRAPQCLTTRCS